MDICSFPAANGNFSSIFGILHREKRLLQPKNLDFRRNTLKNPRFASE
jgi:hypothetical protein